MDHRHSYSFPGLIFLLAQLTYRFVPYGYSLVTFLLFFFLLYSAVQLIYPVCRRRATGQISAK
jgi:hypothetical protein